MPKDATGKVADVAIYGVSTFNRTNMGRFYDQYFNAAAYDLTQRLRNEVGIAPHMKPTNVELNNALQNSGWVTRTFDTLLEFYSIVAPLMVPIIKAHPNPAEHVRSILRDGIFLHIPSDSPNNYLQTALALENSPFKPHYGPVTYRDMRGEMVTTEHPVLIGNMQFLLLEKTAEDWSGVASVKLQHFGIPAKLNQYDRSTSPGRQQSVRGLGESETRSYNAYVTPEVTMEFLDQSNSPDVHRHVTQNILEAPKPTNIDRVVDRERFPYGGSRPVAITQHFFNCRGIKFHYQPEQDSP